MCKVTDYISSKNFGHLYDVVISQRKYFNYKKYWKEAHGIYCKQFAIWERLEGAANGDLGSVGINMICLHRHLKLSKRTSPYSIIKELSEFFSKKIGTDLFKDYESFDNWQSQFPEGRFELISHKYNNIINGEAK